MKPPIAPARPFEPGQYRRFVRGRIEVRVAADAAFEDIPTGRGVRFGANRAATRIDGGPLDAVLRHFTTTMRVTRTYGSAKNCGQPDREHLNWDDLEHRLGLSRSLRIDVDPDADVLGLVDALRERIGVEQAAPAYLCQTPFSLRHPTASASPSAPGDPAAFDMIGAGRALAVEPGDPTVIVAIIDTGVTPSHPELKDILRPGADMVELVEHLLSRGLRFTGRQRTRERDVTDDLGHGTGVAGIIGARGLSVPRGVAGACSILPVRALVRVHKVGEMRPVAIGVIPDIDAAVKLAVDLGAKVLNLSFGTPHSALRLRDPIPHKAVVDYALQRGCIPIAASGNDGNWTTYYPAALPGVIAVGSVDLAGDPSTFSTRGEHVAVCAPGERIPCIAVDGYAENTGTSFAAPFVAAAAAMLTANAHRQAVPLRSEQVKDLLVRSAAPFSGHIDQRGSGAGILDLPAALDALRDLIRGPPEPRRSHPFDPRTSLGTPSRTSQSSFSLSH